MGAGLARRHHQRHLGTVTRPHPQQFQRTHLNSPQSPGSSWTSCLCATRLAAGILQHTKSGWTLVVIAGGATKRYRKDAGAGGKYARPLRHHQSSGGDSRKYPWRVSIDANALSKYGRLRANYASVDSIGQRNSYVKTWGCGGFLNETNIYSRGKSLCF